MFERLDEIERTYEDVERQLADPEVLADQTRLIELSRRHAELGEVVRTYRAWRSAGEDLTAARELLREERSADGRSMLDEELADAQARQAALEEQLRRALVPKDPNDDKDVIVEVRAGTGGDEAALFASDLHRMYTRWAEQHGYKVEVLSQSESDLEGVKEVVFAVKGGGAWSRPASCSARSARPTAGRCWTRRSPTPRPARPPSRTSCGGPWSPRTPTTTRT